MRRSLALLSLGAALHITAPGLVVAPVSAQPREGATSTALRASPDEASRAFIGVWALTDNNNNLFNVRILPDGKAVSTVGTAGVPNAGSARLRNSQFRELGRWSAWGNGIRVDYSDGWSDWIYVGPSGLSHAAWRPGQARSEIPANFGTAVKLGGAAAEAVGIYLFPPAQSDLKPYTAALLSNGLAFNDIDAQAGGVWHMEGTDVVINWISGWRTNLSLAPATRLQLRHWAPGRDRSMEPTAVRKATAVD